MRWVAVVLSVVGLMACLPASTQGETFTPGFAYTQYAFKIGDGEFFRNDVLRLMGKDDHVDVDVYLMLEDSILADTPKKRVASAGLAKAQVILGPQIPPSLRPPNDWSSLISAVANPQFGELTNYRPDVESDDYTKVKETNNTATIRISEKVSEPSVNKPFAAVIDFDTDGFGILLGTFTFTGVHAGSVTYWTQGMGGDSTDLATKGYPPFVLDPIEPAASGGNISLTIEVVAVPLPSVAWSAILGLGVLGISRIVGRSRLHA
jgi:hypothetical protein